MDETIKLFKNAAKRIRLACDAVRMSAVFDAPIIELRVQKAEEAVDNLERHLNDTMNLDKKQRCSLCKGTGKMPGYHDVEEYYKD